jgi:hypothetical protein
MESGVRDFETLGMAIVIKALVINRVFDVYYQPYYSNRVI